jgi:hypothetical protein
MAPQNPKIQHLIPRPHLSINMAQSSCTFLYYCRACDPCILPALNEIGSEQASPSTDTTAKIDMLMDYLHTYPNTVICYHASDMILEITSNAAYLVQPKAHSRAAVHYYLGWRNSDCINGPVNVLCKTIKNLVSSAAEAETSGIYLGGKHAYPLRAMLAELGHPQPSAGSTFRNQQQHCPRHPQFQNVPKALKIFRHALLVDEGQHQTRSVQPPMGTRQTQLDQLSHQAKTCPGITKK